MPFSVCWCVILLLFYLIFFISSICRPTEFKARSSIDDVTRAVWILSTGLHSASAAPLNFNSPKNFLLAKTLTGLSLMYTERTGRQKGNVGQNGAMGEMYHLRGGLRSLGILSVAPDIIHGLCVAECRSQWLRGLTRRSVAARLLRLWVRIPPGARMFVCCEWCVLSGKERSLRRANPSSRGVLPTVMRRCVIQKPREWGGHGPLGAVAPNKKM